MEHFFHFHLFAGIAFYFRLVFSHLVDRASPTAHAVLDLLLHGHLQRAALGNILIASRSTLHLPEVLCLLIFHKCFLRTYIKLLTVYQFKLYNKLNLI